MDKIASELLVERLADWGVDTVFGLPGDGINGIMEGLRRHQDRVRFVLVHHEETAVLGTGHQQEVHLDRLLMDLAEYNVLITTPASIPSLVDRAMRTLARRTVSHLTFPNDLQVAAADAEPWPSVGPARTPVTAPTFLGAARSPTPAAWSAPPRSSTRGPRWPCWSGVGALAARDEALAAAEALASPIVKTLPGKAAVPDDHPLTTGGLGLLGTRPSVAVMHECDTLLMVGTDFPYTAHLPEPGQARTVQIDSDPIRAGNRMPTDVPLVGDAAAALRRCWSARKTAASWSRRSRPWPPGVRTWRPWRVRTATPSSPST